MLTLEQAQAMVAVALAHGRTAGMRPLTVVVLGARAAGVAAASEDGSWLKRFEIARGKGS
ncbi:MAG: heme-binding protein, partial [Pseudorhodobacter sp.]|nr:heme-binding protein [Pseudorhodobacter sp.]